MRDVERRPLRAACIAAAITAATGLALLAAGCGGSSGSRVAQFGTTTTHRSSPSRDSTYQQALAYTRCVRSDGVALWPDPENSGAFDKSKLTPHQLGVGSSQIAAAIAAALRAARNGRRSTSRIETLTPSARAQPRGAGIRGWGS